MAEKPAPKKKEKKTFRQLFAMIRELWHDALSNKDERRRFWKSVGAEAAVATIWAALSPTVIQASTNALVQACTLGKFSWQLGGLVALKEALLSSDSFVSNYASRARKTFALAFGQRRRLAKTKEIDEIPESARSGKDIKILTQTADQIGTSEANVLMDLTALGFCIPACLISLGQVLFRAPAMLPIVLTGAVINSGLSYWRARKNEKDNNDFRKAKNEFASRAIDVAEHSQRVKDLGIKDKEYSKLAEYSDRAVSIMDSLNQRFYKTFGVEISVWALTKMVIAVLTGMSAVTMGKEAGVGTFMAITAAASFAMGTADSASAVVRELREDLDKWKHTKAEFSYDHSHDLTYGDVTPSKIQGNFSIRGVSYTYPGQDKPALQNINLELGNGLTVITGPSGGGKTTLLKLLEHRREGTGKVTLDGIEITDFAKGFLEQQMAIVNQQPDYFEQRNIDENLTSVRADADITDKKEALESVGLYQEIGAKGMNKTMHELSGGQRQRENLAEAVLQKKPIMFYDEPTANLDYKSRRKNWHKLLELAKDHTVIVVSHNAQEIESADRVICIEDGRITQDGAPEELIQKKGFVREILKNARRSLRITEEQRQQKKLDALQSAALQGLKSKSKKKRTKRLRKVLGQYADSLQNASSIQDVDTAAITAKIAEAKAHKK